MERFGTEVAPVVRAEVARREATAATSAEAADADATGSAAATA